MSWSGGKDSSLALYEIQSSKQYEISALITTVTSDYDRVSMHGLRTTLLDEQARSLNIPLEKVLISKLASNEEYERKFNEVLLKYKQSGINQVVFGDIFLEDIKKYRQQLLSKVEMECLFPIWQKDSSQLAHDFINSGFKAVTVCIDSEVLGEEFAGRQFDERFFR